MGVLGETGNISPRKAMEPFPAQLRFIRGVVLGPSPHWTAAACLHYRPGCVSASSEAGRRCGCLCAAAWSPLVKVMAMGPHVLSSGLWAPPVGFAGAEGGLAEPARPGLGPGGGTWSPGSCSSPLSWHLPQPALAVGVGFGCGLGLLKAGLHFITAPGRAR